VSFLFADPEALVTAASDLSGIGSTLSAANAGASAPTMGVAAAAADDVSAQVAAFFSQHGLGYQQLGARMAAFHEQFVETLGASASAFAAAEANATQTLVNAVNAPAATLLGSGAGAGSAGGIAGGAGGVVSNAVNRIESVVAGSNFLGGAGLLGGGSAQAIASQAGALLLAPTGGIRALTAASALLAPAAMTNAAVGPLTLASRSIGNAIEAAYLAIEPYVQYGFNLAAYAAGFVVGGLAPQINFFYYLFEPIVQSGLFNTLDWLGGEITFAQGLSNFWAATTASINQFINTEINWALSFLPPLPPLPGIILP
jgi:PE family